MKNFKESINKINRKKLSSSDLFLLSSNKSFEEIMSINNPGENNFNNNLIVNLEKFATALLISFKLDTISSVKKLNNNEARILFLTVEFIINLFKSETIFLSSSHIDLLKDYTNLLFYYDPTATLLNFFNSFNILNEQIFIFNKKEKKDVLKEYFQLKKINKINFAKNDIFTNEIDNLLGSYKDNFRGRFISLSLLFDFYSIVKIEYDESDFLILNNNSTFLEEIYFLNTMSNKKFEEYFKINELSFTECLRTIVNKPDKFNNFSSIGIKKIQNKKYEKKYYNLEKETENFFGMWSFDKAYTKTFKRTITQIWSESRLDPFNKLADENTADSINELNKKNDDEINKLLKLIDNVKGYSGTDSFGTKLFDVFDAFSDVVLKGDDVYLLNLKNNYEELSAFNLDKEDSIDTCMILNAAVYLIFAFFEFEDTNDKAVNDIKNLLYDLKNKKWNPKESFLDNSFFKKYSSFYNFVTGEKNPFNDFLKDNDFVLMQEQALEAREKMYDTVDKVIDNIEDAIYAPNSNGISVWSSINVLADSFLEASMPLEFQLILGNFSFDLFGTLFNVGLEFSATWLIDQFNILFEKEFIKLNGKKYSINELHFELLKLKDLLSMFDGENLTIESFRDTIKSMKEDFLAPVPTDKNDYRTLLNKECFFTLGGLESTTSTVTFSVLKNYADNLKEAVNTNSDFSKTMELLFSEPDIDYEKWNLYSNKKDYYFLIKFIIQKMEANQNYEFKFYDYNFLKSKISDLNIDALTFCFLSSQLKNLTFLKELYDIGYDPSNFYNSNIANFFPTTTETTFNYYDLYNTFIKKDKESDENKFSILMNNIRKTKTYKEWKLNISNSTRMFSFIVNKRKELLEIQSDFENTTALLDTIARLLPTTNLLVGNFKLPILSWLNDFIDCIGAFQLTILNFIKQVTIEYKKDMDIYFKNVSIQHDIWNLENRTRSIAYLIDALFSSIDKLRICKEINLMNQLEYSFNIFSLAEKTSNSLNVDGVKTVNIPTLEESSFVPSENITTISDNSNGLKTDVDNLTSEEIKTISENLTNKIVYQIDDPDTKEKVLLITENKYTTGELVNIALNFSDDRNTVPTFKKINDKLTDEEYVFLKPIDGTLESKLSDFLSYSSNEVINASIDYIKKNSILNQIDSLVSNKKIDSKRDALLKENKNIQSGFSITNDIDNNYVDFKKIKPKYLIDSIKDFNYTKFIDFAYTVNQAQEMMDNEPK